eukprot:1159943-Prorocentrum_minimum.AAC.2
MVPFKFWGSRNAKHSPDDRKADESDERESPTQVTQRNPPTSSPAMSDAPSMPTPFPALMPTPPPPPPPSETAKSKPPSPNQLTPTSSDSNSLQTVLPKSRSGKRGSLASPTNSVGTVAKPASPNLKHAMPKVYIRIRPLQSEEEITLWGLTDKRMMLSEVLRKDAVS